MKDTEDIARLPDIFGSHSLHELCDWLNRSRAAERAPHLLTEKAMLSAGFSERPFAEEELYAGQSSYSGLAEIRRQAGPVQTSIIDTAPVPVAWNEDEVLVRDGRRFRVDTWAEFGVGISCVLRDLVDPAHYSPEDYIEMMKGPVRSTIR